LTEKLAADRCTAAIILAAGAATRMGQLKQLLVYRGKTLLQRAIDQAIGAAFEPIIVVVGSDSRMLRESLTGQRVEIVQNAKWQSGMGSSIAVGMQALLKGNELPSAVAILVVDQPLIEAKHLARMRQLLSTPESSIVAAQYSDTLGVPALFKQDLFHALSSLPPEAGARSLLRSSYAKVTSFPLPEAAVDIDTPDDFEAFTSAVDSRRQK
jgi:molybdenum cofactor cytidylyltransferase